MATSWKSFCKGMELEGQFYEEIENIREYLPHRSRFQV